MNEKFGGKIERNGVGMKMLREIDEKKIHTAFPDFQSPHQAIPVGNLLESGVGHQRERQTVDVGELAAAQQMVQVQSVVLVLLARPQEPVARILHAPLNWVCKLIIQKKWKKGSKKTNFKKNSKMKKFKNSKMEKNLEFKN